MVYVKIMWYHGQNPINYVQSKLRGPVCEFCLTNVNLSGNYKQWRARDLKFLVHLEKLVESCGLRFGVMSKMRDFTQPSICLLKTQIKIRNNNLKLVCFWTTELFYFFVPCGSASSEMTTISVPKLNWGQLSKKKQTNAQKPIFRG